MWNDESLPRLIMLDATERAVRFRVDKINTRFSGPGVQLVMESGSYVVPQVHIRMTVADLRQLMDAVVVSGFASESEKKA